MAMFIGHLEFLKSLICTLFGCDGMSVNGKDEIPRFRSRLSVVYSHGSNSSLGGRFRLLGSYKVCKLSAIHVILELFEHFRKIIVVPHVNVHFSCCVL